MGRTSRLAIDGGAPLRMAPMPPRFAIGPAERAMINEALDLFAGQGLDPGYQGVFEERYCKAFAEAMGGGYADAVATGTTALYVALAALNLPKGSQVLCSPITDPGTLSAIVLLGLVPRLADAMPDSYNVGLEQIAERLYDDVSCVLAVHSIGYAVPIDTIVETAHARGIKVLEDCSQAHGALLKGRRVGTFGDVATFSTMYRKASITGASGGVVFTTHQDIYRMALAHADRGKPRWREGFDDRDPAQFLFPALNLHTDELSCAVGLASIGRLEDTRTRRLAFVEAVSRAIGRSSGICRPYGYDAEASPFIYPVFVDIDAISVTKQRFAEAIRAEGIGLNSHYRYLAADWPWLQPYLADAFACPNARRVIDRTFNLYLNENYGPREAEDCAAAIMKVEEAYRL
jgi:dTDP-4-amino-4,6-dideoxygalactose transaminase